MQPIHQECVAAAAHPDGLATWSTVNNCTDVNTIRSKLLELGSGFAVSELVL